METAQRTSSPQAARLLGRVLNIRGQMHFVVNVDENTGFATLAFDSNGKKRALHVPLPEVLWWVMLDNNASERALGPA